MCMNPWKRELARELARPDQQEHPMDDADHAADHAAPVEEDWDMLQHDSQPPDVLPEQPELRAQNPQVTVEEEEDVDAPNARFPMKYPGGAAEVLGEGKTEFERLRDKQEAAGSTPHEPFEDQDEWELAEWLMKRANKTGIEEFLKLPIVC
jgi:hypothetical protein